jgi:hypothetical protein
LARSRQGVSKILQGSLRSQTSRDWLGTFFGEQFGKGFGRANRVLPGFHDGALCRLAAKLIHFLIWFYLAYWIAAFYD